jgi:hypothetical protein
MALVPTDLNIRLTRVAAAEALTTAGFPVSPATLATKATRGGGPPFQRFGRVPLYRWGDCLDWAHSRLSAPLRSTSEGDAVDASGRRRQNDQPSEGAAILPVPLGPIISPPRLDKRGALES